MSALLEETLKALNRLNDYDPHQSRYQKAKKSLIKLLPQLITELHGELLDAPIEQKVEKEPKRKSSEAEEGAVKAKKSVSIKADPPKKKSKSQTKK